MIQKLIKQIFPLTIIVGLVAMITVNLLSDNSFTVVSRETVYIGKYTWTYYQFHLDRYLQSLSTSTNILQLKAVIQDAPSYPIINWNSPISVRTQCILR